MDTLGNHYLYGALDSGHLMRLEDGAVMDTGNKINHEMHLGMFTIDDAVWNKSQILNHLMVLKDTDTVETVLVKHYGDSDEAGTTLAAELDPTKDGSVYNDEFTKAPVSANSPNGHVFHSLKYTTSTDDQVPGFHPLFIGLKMRLIGEVKS
jgi:hypothetical protein